MEMTDDNEGSVKRFFEKMISDPAYYDGDPKQGGKRIERTGSSGLYEMMKPFYDDLEKQGEPIPVPIHNYELLKSHRQKQYERDLAHFLSERRYNGLSDTAIDIGYFRLEWLQDELSRNVEVWLSPTYPNGKKKRIHRTSDVIEIRKYKAFIVNEKKALEEYLQTYSGDNDSGQENVTEINSPGFEIYIIEHFRDKLIPYLKRHYQNKAPKEITPMLYALESLKCLNNDINQFEQKDLHSALQNTFGDIGLYTSYNESLNKYYPETADSVKKQKIEKAKELIKKGLEG